MNLQKSIFGQSGRKPVIGQWISETARLVSECYGFGIKFEKGAEIDHMEIGAQRNYIWKANFPDWLAAENVKLFEKQTLTKQIYGMKPW